MNHRTMPRLRRRLRIQFAGFQAFTSDISPGGFAVQLMQSLRPGSLHHGTIELDGQVFEFSGHICWCSPGDSRMNLRGHFGVRFISMPNAFFVALQSAYSAAARVAA